MNGLMLTDVKVWMEIDKVKEIFKDPRVRASYEGFVVAGFAQNLQNNIEGFVLPQGANAPSYTPTAEELLQYVLVAEATSEYLLANGGDGDLKKAICTMLVSVPWLTKACM